jgi:diaminopimelate epimerase
MKNIFNICGNKIIIKKIKVPELDKNNLFRFHKKCWKGDIRIADGICFFSIDNNLINIIFFNPDGTQEEMCGNALFGICKIINNKEKIKLYSDKSLNIHIYSLGEKIILESVNFYNTGSPHILIESNSIEEINENIINILTKLFNCNFTFYKKDKKQIIARTFERGVGETLSCGTGALAIAIECIYKNYNFDKIYYQGGYYSLENYKFLKKHLKICLSIEKSNILKE